MSGHKFKIIELFSGIGSQARAFKNIKMNISTVGTCEWDIHAMVAYDAIHNSPTLPNKYLEIDKEELLEILKKYTISNDGKTPMQYSVLRSYSVDALRRIYAAIDRCNNFVDVTALHGEDLPNDIDAMTYSFPCQDLSNVGAFHGYNKGIDKDSGSRSSLLWQVGRILNEMKNANINLPKFLIMENVPSLLSPRHFGNFEEWINLLSGLGYYSEYFQLNASAFGLPQNRPRLIMISVFVGDDNKKRELVEKYFKGISSKKIVDDYAKSKFYDPQKIEDLLRIDYTNSKLLLEAIECTPNDTISRRTIWDENPQILLKGNIINSEYDVVRTLTTKQDRNPNSGNLYFDSGLNGKSKFRYLTPRECLLFMGFTDFDYENLITNNTTIHKGTVLFPRDKIIRMAGNSIPVKMLEGVFLQVKKINRRIKKYEMTYVGENEHK